VKPFIQALTDSHIDTTVVVYLKQTSCKGVSALLADEALPTGDGAGVLGALDSCTAAADTLADIGASDVFADSCPNVTFPDPDKPQVADYQGPIQAMNFIVPKAAFDNGTKSISAQAAYLVFGFDPGATDAASGKAYGNGTPWLSMDNIWVRDETSGTQTMLGVAINVPAAASAQFLNPTSHYSVLLATNDVTRPKPDDTIPEVAGRLTAWTFEPQGAQHVAYRGKDGQIYDLYDIDGDWFCTDASGSATAPPATAADDDHGVVDHVELPGGKQQIRFHLVREGEPVPDIDLSVCHEFGSAR